MLYLLTDEVKIRPSVDQNILNLLFLHIIAILHDSSTLQVNHLSQLRQFRGLKVVERIDKGKAKGHVFEKSLFYYVFLLVNLFEVNSVFLLEDKISFDALGVFWRLNARFRLFEFFQIIQKAGSSHLVYEWYQKNHEMILFAFVYVQCLNICFQIMIVEVCLYFCLNGYLAVIAVLMFQKADGFMNSTTLR